MEYYTLPVNCAVLMERAEKHPKQSLEKSITANIYLILATKYGSKRYDQSFGNELLDYDFDNPSVIERVKHRFEVSIKELIKTCEKRLEEIKVIVRLSIEDLYFDKDRKMTRVKKKIEISISGKLILINRTYSPPPFVIYFSPASISSSSK